MLVVTLGGSPSQRSRSGVLLDHSRRWLQQQGVEVVSYQIRDFPAEDLLYARFDSPQVLDLLAQVANADGLLIATPVYKASFSGALKTILDLLPERARLQIGGHLNSAEGARSSSGLQELITVGCWQRGGSSSSSSSSGCQKQ